MKKLNTRKRSGNLAARLVYVTGTAGDIYVMADEDEGFSGERPSIRVGDCGFWLNAKRWIGSIRPKANSAGIGLPFLKL